MSDHDHSGDEAPSRPDVEASASQHTAAAIGATPSAAAPPIAHTADPTTPLLALPAAPPPDMRAVLDMIGRGLSPEADDAARDAARELWGRLAESLATAAPANASAPGMPPHAGSLPPVHGQGMYTTPTVALPATPIAMAARALKQMTPDQLIDLVLQRLRAALPAGSAVAAPRGIQFPLVPVPPHGAR